MQIKQFEDKNLAHFSYAIMSDCEKKIVLIDPTRDPHQYLKYAKDNKAQITGIIETHPHADFISSHLELHNTLGAVIYASKMTGAAYPYQSFDEGQDIILGKIKLSALNTPGHSPDSICIVLEHDGKQEAVFTGDTLFIGDCGRPDLRPDASNAKDAAIKLAKQMYHSLRDKLMPLQDDVIVYPAHGAGSLCGKSLSKAPTSTIGEERKSNWSLQQQPEEEFVKELLSGQPFIPAYFPYDVALNKKGAKAFNESIRAVKIGEPVTNESTKNRLTKAHWIIDVREADTYKKGHLLHSVNLMKGAGFETWLGSIIKPDEHFYIVAADEKSIQQIIARTAVIGYESQVEEAFLVNYTEVTEEKIDVQKFREDPNTYTIIDVRNTSEIKDEIIFENSLSIPLGELRERLSKIPLDKPIVVHCASGYRSAAGSSLLQSVLTGKAKVFDLGKAVKKFM
ncbi:MAG: MBL fold metallo-hydrolase [Ginsengibacter sp.]